MNKKQAVDMKVNTGAVEEFFERTREIARKIDKGEKLTPEFTLTFEDPADLMRALSTE